MTEQAIRDMVSDFRREREKDIAFARFCQEQAPGYISGCVLFAAPRWEADWRDPDFDAALLLLQQHGYRV